MSNYSKYEQLIDKILPSKFLWTFSELLNMWDDYHCSNHTGSNTVYRLTCIAKASNTLLHWLPMHQATSFYLTIPWRVFKRLFFFASWSHQAGLLNASQIIMHHICCSLILFLEPSWDAYWLQFLQISKKLAWTTTDQTFYIFTHLYLAVIKKVIKVLHKICFQRKGGRGT